MQSVLHLQGEPHQHRRADQRHAADPEHSRAQAAEHRRRPRRQQGRQDRHRRRYQSMFNRMILCEEDTGMFVMSFSLCSFFFFCFFFG